MSWILSHTTIVAALGVAVLDFIFALNPNTAAADGVLHALYLWLQGFSKKA